MSLIKCEECGKDISDKAESCPNCGYPLIKKDAIINDNNFYSIKLIVSSQKINEIKVVREILGLGLKEAKDIVDSKNAILAQGLTKSEVDKLSKELSSNGLNVEIISRNSNIQPQTIYSEPRCPKCNSTNFDMIKRNWSFTTGFMTNKVDRVCRNCKHKF